MARSKKGGVSGLNPLAYLGVEPSAPSEVLLNKRRPTAKDFSDYVIGTWWLFVEEQEVWLLIDKREGLASWIMLYPSSSGAGASTFEADTGTANEVDETIKILGSKNISTSATGNTITIDLEDSISISNNLTISGSLAASALLNVGDACTDTFVTCGTTLEVKNGITIASGGLDSTGQTRIRSFSSGVLQSDTYGSISSPAGTDGQVLLAGTDGPKWSNITSNDGTLVITEGANSINIDQAGGAPAIATGANVSFYATGSVTYNEYEIFSPTPSSPYYFPIGSKFACSTAYDTYSKFFPGDGAGKGAYYIVPISGKYLISSVQYIVKSSGTGTKNDPAFLMGADIKIGDTHYCPTGCDYVVIPAKNAPPIMFNTEVMLDLKVGDRIDFSVFVYMNYLASGTSFRIDGSNYHETDSLPASHIFGNLIG